MIETIQTLNYFLALAGIGGIFVTIVLLIDFKGKRIFNSFVLLYGLVGAFLVVIGSSFLTLIYSEYFGIVPCGLCWLERVALYPQVLLIATAIYSKDKTMPKYGIVLSGVGLVVSLYHHYIQMGGSQFIKCPVAGAGADCAKRFFFEFNFMTFPLMSAILFAFLIVLYFYMLKAQKVLWSTS